MKFIMLTRCVDGASQLVNMSLVSEVVAVQGQGTYTNLVVPSAVYQDARYIAVKETPEQIAALIANG